MGGGGDGRGSASGALGRRPHVDLPERFEAAEVIIFEAVLNELETT
jgi:hypothetical protein